MTSFVQDTLESTSGFALQTDEYGYITQNGSIVVTGNAISSGVAENNVNIINNGSVFGSLAAISLGGQGNYIANNGTLQGQSIALILSVSGVDRLALDVIYNTGVIEGIGPNADGILARMGGVKIINSGSILTSGDDAIQIGSSQPNGVQTNEIINSGLIATTGDGFALELESLGNLNLITNTGEIHGDIQLGNLDDVLQGSTGFINGTIDARSGDDLIKSGIGDDMINGGSGRDKMYGGEGNDTATYEGSSAGVRVSLTSNRGRGGEARGDWLFDIENLIGSNQDDVLIGNAVSNILEGGNGADTLNGEGGIDFLFGEIGDDTLIGGDGDDILNGGLGRDILWSGDGADIFEFLDVAESGTGSSRDVIKDFEQGADLIDLSAMGATSFSAGGFTMTAGEVSARLIGGGSKTLVEYDDDGDGVADFKILINNGGFTIAADDFILG